MNYIPISQTNELICQNTDSFESDTSESNVFDCCVTSISHPQIKRTQSKTKCQDASHMSG